MLQHCERLLSDENDHDRRKNIKSLAKQMKMAMRGTWDDTSGDVFDPG